jgi:hypothetical protein
MNRTRISLQVPMAAATAALAVTVGMFGYLTFHEPQARPATPTVFTSAERGAADRMPDVERTRELAFTECPQGLVSPPLAC